MTDLSDNDKHIIRPATREDCPGIIELIKMLARYEKMEDKVRIDASTLIKDGFTEGREPSFNCFVSQDKSTGQLVGYLIYYYTYSTWEGKSIYMEDIFVDPNFRRLGIGRKLITQLAKTAKDQGIKRIDLSILDWNNLSIQFHESLGAVNLTQSQGWHIYRLSYDCIKKIADNKA